MAAPVPVSGGGERTAMVEVLIGLFLIWLIWVYSGGPARVEEAKKPFLKPPAPLNTGAVYGEMPTIEVPDLNAPTFDMKKNIRVGGGIDYSNASLSASRDEETGLGMIEIAVRQDSKKLLDITGWSVKGVMDKEPRVIGTGAQVFYQGRVNSERDIVLYPGEKAIVLAGDSPVGVSFKVNKCSGFLEQFQSFTPSFPTTCPHPALDQTIYTTDLVCSQFMRSILRCNAFVGEYPSNINSECKDLIDANLTYNSCIKNHAGDSTFYKGEWRVYLGGSDSFGSDKGDVVTVYDANGNEIDSIIF